MGIKISITPDNKRWLLSLAGIVITALLMANTWVYIVEGFTYG